jgi:diaminohydroxyphosphoribosylaminopyrimidine deaminase/5-amino-6-(5-phosphoribosylamino)uracil reductase
LYCTLEPCAHTGRTGPCAPLVAAAGISRVVVATADPNPLAGGGGDLLRRQGVEFVSGVLADEARQMNAAFFSVVERQRPYVTMKVALSLDGFIAGEGGSPLALTAAPANRLVHRERAEVDAIAVGSGTVLADNPRLTARVAYRSRPLIRVVFDARLRTPAGARLLGTLDAGPVIIVTSEASLAERHASATALRTAGAVLLPLPVPHAVGAALRELVAHGVSSMVVEGGASLHRAFWQAGVVDRVQLFVADRSVGDKGLPWLEEPVLSAPRIGSRAAKPVGADVLLEGYVHGAH